MSSSAGSGFGVIALALASAFAAWPFPAAGLSSDRDQPMYIEADRADINDKKGISIYTGNVKVTQGTFELLADKLTVYIEKDQLQKAIAIGQPAHYRQRPDGKDEDIEAQALRMEYYASPERIILLERAQASQAGDVFRSEKIVYDIDKDVVNAGTGSGNDRVHITLQPRKKEPATTADGKSQKSQ
jgi:lipopolysaccharide export system protein LptA